MHTPATPHDTTYTRQRRSTARTLSVDSEEYNTGLRDSPRQLPLTFCSSRFRDVLWCWCPELFSGKVWLGLCGSTGYWNSYRAFYSQSCRRLKRSWRNTTRKLFSVQITTPHWSTTFCKPNLISSCTFIANTQNLLSSLVCTDSTNLNSLGSIRNGRARPSRGTYAGWFWNQGSIGCSKVV